MKTNTFQILLILLLTAIALLLAVPYAQRALHRAEVARAARAELIVRNQAYADELNRRVADHKEALVAVTGPNAELVSALFIILIRGTEKAYNPHLDPVQTRRQLDLVAYTIDRILSDPAR